MSFVDLILIYRIALGPTRVSDYQIHNTKCMFITVQDKLIFITDHGLHCFYVIDLENNFTT